MSNEILESKRWLIAGAAIVMQLCLGTVYAWSVFKIPLMKAHGWSDFEVSSTMMILMAVIGVSAAFGGTLVDKKGPRFVATIGGILFGSGVLLAGFADQVGNLFLLYLGFGIIGGLCNGFGYVTPIAKSKRQKPMNCSHLLAAKKQDLPPHARRPADALPFRLESGLGTHSTSYSGCSGRSAQSEMLLRDAFDAYDRLWYHYGRYEVSQGKADTYSVEAGNAELRHYLARLARSSRCFSRCPHALECAVRLFVYWFNSRQLYKQRYTAYSAHLKDFIGPLS